MTPDMRSELRAMMEDLEQRAAHARLQADLLRAESDVASIDDDYAAAVKRLRRHIARVGRRASAQAREAGDEGDDLRARRAA